MDRQRHLLRRAWLSLFIERWAQAFWPVVALALAGLGLVLSGALLAWPLRHLPWLGWVLLVGVVALALWRARLMRWPQPADTRARADADDPARPLAMWGDKPLLPGHDPALWSAHQRQMAARLAGLRPARPRPDLARHDPFALRLIALMICLIGAAVGWGQGRQHLSLAFEGATVPRPPVRFEIWATPPAHTGLAAQMFAADASIDLPQGTQLRVQAHHSRRAPQLTWQGKAQPMQDLGGESWSGTLPAEIGPAKTGPAETGLVEAGILTLRARGQSLTLTLGVIPDKAPTIVIEGVPGATADHELEVEFTASDDYGVARIEAIMALGEDADPRPDQVIEVPLPFGKQGVHQGHWIEDLSAHPLAGQKVDFRLRAHDAQGQFTDSEVVTLTLPQRPLIDPMAKALVYERGQIIRRADRARAALQALGAGTRYPEDYFRDAASLIMTRAALARLRLALAQDQVAAQRDDLAEMLWLAALRLDGGPLANAAERLARARDRLSEALERGASEPEIAQLMDELRAAIKEFLNELLARGEQMQQDAGEQGEQGDARQLTQQDLQDLLQQLEEAARNGQADMAQQMLSMLDQLLRGLQPGQQGQGQGGQGGQGQALQEMMRRQQGLADESFQNFREQMRRQREQSQGQGEQGQGEQGQGEQGQGREGQLGERDDPRSLDQIARDQEALRQELEGMNGGNEAADEALDNARDAMNEAEQALREGDAEGAAQAQIDAMEAIGDGIRAQRDTQNAQGQGREGKANGRDPKGRAMGRSGAGDGRETRTPTEDSRARARALTETLRRRAAEQDRPAAERKLLEDLLRRF